jgi:hypothetical protein
MNTNPNSTAWHSIENQIKILKTFENQIEDLRRQLAEDWRLRLTQYFPDVN